jgi:RimJ/RimL family protein N-acetyltransferase
MEARSFAGVEFDKSETLANGDTLYVLVLRDKGAEIVLATIWLQLMGTGLLDVVWPGGIPSLTWLIKWATQPNNYCFGCFLVKADTEDLMIVGLGWTVTVTKVGTAEDGKDITKAEVGMVFYPMIQKTRLTHHLAEMMISWGFENLNLAVVYGTIPTPNVLACRFAQRAGFTHVGTAPAYQAWKDKPVSCEIYTATREQWYAPRAAVETRELAEA